MNIVTPLRLEEAALNAWAALSQLLYDGWILRFAQGYTKRANSVNPLYASSLPLEAKVGYCESVYAAQGLPTVFRLTPFSQPAGLNDYLAARGYEHLDETLVMTRPIDETLTAKGEMSQLDLDAWLKLYAQCSEQSQQDVHRKILARTAAQPFYCALGDNSCGLGVLDGEYFGLFDIVTAPTHRQQGLGTQLVREMLHLAYQHGAQTAYLQVMATNEVARRLYERLGFVEGYRYWYRVKQGVERKTGTLI